MAFLEKGEGLVLVYVFLFPAAAGVFWGNDIPLPPLYLNLTSVLPQFNLLLTFFEPHFNLCFVTNLEPRFGNHSLQTLGGLTETTETSENN